MEQKQVTYYAKLIKQGLILGLVSAVFVVFAQSLFSDDGFLQEQWRKFTFDNTVRAAHSYQGRNYDYLGVCEDTAFPGYIRCIEDGETFKIEMDNKQGGVYCADSTGYKSMLGQSTGMQQLCR